MLDKISRGIEMENNAKMIEISLDDPKETQFLTELNVKKDATEPTTYVVNSKGQSTGTFTDVVNATTLVASAQESSRFRLLAGRK